MKTVEVGRKIAAQPASTLEAAEVEGIQAALGGCAGTHNPHVFGDPALREAWARGLRQVHAYRDRELEIQAGRGLHPMAAELAHVLGLLAQLARAHQESVQFLRLLGGRDARDDCQRVLSQLGELDAGNLEALATRVLSCLPPLPVPQASDGAGDVIGDDTPERLPYQHDLLGQYGDHYAGVEVESDPEDVRLPVSLTLHRAVLLEAHEGGDEADVVVPLSPDEAQALGESLVAGARAGRGRP